MKVVKGFISFVCGTIGFALEQVIKILCFVAEFAYMIIGICAVYCICSQLWPSLWILLGIALAIFVVLLLMYMISDQLMRV